MGHLGINSLSQLNPEEHKPFFAYVDNLKEGLSAAQKKLPPALKKGIKKDAAKFLKSKDGKNYLKYIYILSKGDKKDEQWGANKASGGKVGDKKKHEDLTPKQKQLDKDKDGDIGADDLAKLRATKKEEAIAPFRISYSDKYGKHAGFEDGKSLQDIQNKAQKLRAKGFKIDKPGYPINVGSLDKKLKENLNEKIEYAYLQFRNKNEANRAARTAAELAGHNTQMSGQDVEIEVSSGGAGENLTIDGGKNDVSKIVKELVRLYRPKVLEKESLDKSVKEKMGANTPSNPNRYKQYLKRTGQKLSNELTPKQKMLDKDKDGDIGGDDLAKVRATKKETENKKYLQTKPGSLEEAILKSRGLIK